MLIDHPRITSRDREVWDAHARADAATATSPRLARAIRRACRALADFCAQAAGGYIGVSWGKDSIVVAHLAYAVGSKLPLVWIRIDPVANPDCLAVRDAFLRRHPMPYDEIVVACARTASRARAGDERCGLRTSGWQWRGALERGFAIARKRHGERYVSGIRGAESSARARRMSRWGEATAATCAPIGWWTTDLVFAYLARHDLPVHPAYACTGGGIWPRDRIRVAALGGMRGTGHGRAEWETRYYGQEMRCIAAG